MTLEVIVIKKFRANTLSTSLNPVYGDRSKHATVNLLARQLGELNFSTVNKYTNKLIEHKYAINSYDLLGYNKLVYNTTSNVLDTFFLVINRLAELVNGQTLDISYEYKEGATSFSSAAIKQLKAVMKSTIIPITFLHECNFFGAFKNTVFETNVELFRSYVGFFNSVLALVHNFNDKIILNFIS